MGELLASMGSPLDHLSHLCLSLPGPSSGQLVLLCLE